jgi:hypothetical protein
MTTKLDGPLKRELEIGRESYTLTLTPEGLNLALKGRRKGFELRWTDLVSGDAALATALNASLTAPLARPTGKPPAPPAANRPATHAAKQLATRAAKPPARRKAKK